MTCVTYWIAVPHVVWKVRATLIVDWLLLDTLVTASPPKKKKKKKKQRLDRGVLHLNHGLCEQIIQTHEGTFIVDSRDQPVI